MPHLLPYGFSIIDEQRVVLRIDDTLSIEFRIGIASTGVIVQPPPPRPRLLVAEVLDLGDPNRALVAALEISAIDSLHTSPVGSR